MISYTYSKIYFSTHPCVFCDMPSSDFEWSLRNKQFGGNLRTLGAIRKQATSYQQALKSHTKKQKLSSAAYKNCEKLPACYFESNSVKVLELAAPRYYISIIF